MAKKEKLRPPKATTPKRKVVSKRAAAPKKPATKVVPKKPAPKKKKAPTRAERLEKALTGKPKGLSIPELTKATKDNAFKVAHWLAKEGVPRKQFRRVSRGVYALAK